jgi:hypothetical protein
MRHTHDGTCQACGRTQAFNLKSKNVAKHGYTVEHNFFNGVCPGADRKPAQHEITLTNQIIKSCLENAATFDAEAKRLETCVIEKYSENTYVGRDKEGADRYGYKMITFVFAEQPEYKQKSVRASMVHSAEMRRDMNRDHAEMLTTRVLPKFGTALIPAEKIKVEKPANTKVDVKTGHIEGTFRTKSAKKDALEAVSRSFEKVRKAILERVLAVPYEQRSEVSRQLYQDIPYQLNHWRAKHSAATLAVYPDAAADVAEIERLVALRETIKAQEVTK